MLGDRLYPHLPVPMQHAAVSLFGWQWKRKRLGGAFAREVAGFLERERFSTAQWDAWQTERLREVLATAVTRVPYYQRAYASLGLTPERIARFTLADLRELPLLDKEAVRAAPEDFLIDGRPPEGFTICPTSGSTGTPVRTYWAPSDFQRSLALREVRACRAAGVSFGLPRATFSGRLVVPAGQTTPPYYRFNWFEKQVYFSAFHLSPERASAYLEPLERHRVVWATGYTHAFEQLATFMLEQQLRPPSGLRAILTTSEKLTPEGRRTIERAFGCRVYQEYGMVEDVVFAAEDAGGRMRVSPDAGILELVRPDGTSVSVDSADEGAVVATGFIRQHQLLIRYRVGDVASWDPAATSDGSTRPVLREIVGRLEDVVIGPDGRRTVRFHAIFTELPGVREAQVLQEAIDRLRIKVVPSPDFGPATTAEIRKRIHDRFTTAMNVVVEPVESIPRTQAGKFRSVVNLMKPEVLLVIDAQLPFVSVLMPVRDEGVYLERALGAVLAQDYPADRLEILVADGRSTDGTRERIEAASAADPRVRLVDNPGKIVATGLNAAIATARGEVLVRVDGHCEIAPDYVRRCVAHLRQDDIEGVGGSVDTIGETWVAKAIAIAMSSKFGVGGSAFRTVQDKTMLADTIPFPAYNRSLVEQAGPYDEELVRNQDDEYNYRLRKLGARLLLAADVKSRYYSRSTVRKLFRQYYQYGLYKVRVMQKHPRQMSPRQFAPPAFVAALLASGALAVAMPPAGGAFVLLAGTYAAANLAASLLTAGQRDWRALPILPAAFAALHVGYGLGFLAGLVRYRDRLGSESRVSDDLARLRREYADRASRPEVRARESLTDPTQRFFVEQRRRDLVALLAEHGVASLAGRRILEIGCGSGGVLAELATLGADAAGLHGVDLLPDRLHETRARHPDSTILVADGQALPFASGAFDVVLQFTALSSVLSDDIRRHVTAEMRRVLRPGGLILWYDFIWNPTNRQTRGIGRAELSALFPGCDHDLRRVTLAPPLARRLVPASSAAAAALERLRVLNSHYLAIIRPRSPEAAR